MRFGRQVGAEGTSGSGRLEFREHGFRGESLLSRLNTILERALFVADGRGLRQRQGTRRYEECASPQDHCRSVPPKRIVRNFHLLVHILGRLCLLQTEGEVLNPARNRTCLPCDFALP